MLGARHVCIAVATVLAVAAADSAEAEPIPPEMVGIWVTEDAVMQGTLLFEGQAFYLGADGVAAWVAGPPPIGVEMQCSYESQLSAVSCTTIETDGNAHSGRIPYDATSNRFVVDDHPLLRRFEEFDAKTRRALVGTPN